MSSENFQQQTARARSYPQQVEGLSRWANSAQRQIDALQQQLHECLFQLQVLQATTLKNPLASPPKRKEKEKPGSITNGSKPNSAPASSASALKQKQTATATR